jgi:chromosome segregation ATPase
MTPAKLAQVGAARAPASPSAFLNRMAADVGHPHVKRLAELRLELQAGAAESQAATIQPALERLAQALPALDFSLLQPRGWWAGVTGKSRGAGAEFAAQFATMEEPAEDLATELKSVQNQQQPHSIASDRTLVELEVEYRALDKIIDQGARWLQDMRNQLKARQADAGAEAQAQREIDEDSARCEILVARLKALRAAVAASQVVHQEARSTAERRAALMASMDQVVAGPVKAWQARIAGLANAANEGASAGLSLEGPKDAHEDLRQQLSKLIADCGQLRTHETALLQNLASMGEQLDAAS